MVPAGGRIETGDANPTRIYYDTADRDLLRHRITLAHHTDGTDTGWRLMVPADKARTDIRTSAATGDAAIGDVVPEELATLVTGIALGESLRRMAEVSTTRRVHRVLDRDEHLLAEVTDDVVHATVTGDTALISEWREIDVDLGDGVGRSLLTKIDKRLTRAGANPSMHATTLGRALTGDHTPDGADSDFPAREAITRYLDAQVQAIVAGDVWLRRGLEPIHSTRVGIRRFRSTLRVFKTLFDAEPAAHLDAELSWYAGVLGEVRTVSGDDDR